MFLVFHFCTKQETPFFNVTVSECIEPPMKIGFKNIPGVYKTVDAISAKQHSHEQNL